MIRIKRGAEPKNIVEVRNKELPILRALVAPTGEQIAKTYKVVGPLLWERQFNKCCYCEKIIPKGYNDVEHYRPKGRAVRDPGCRLTHGYWWLAYSWDNLLFSCSHCNRSAKNDLFPLDRGSTSLIAEDVCPGQEKAMLIDPGALTNPVEHIEFVYECPVIGQEKHWWARPRDGSAFGSYTIKVCDLNRAELRELRTNYVNNHVSPQIQLLKTEIALGDSERILHSFKRALELMSPKFEFSALTYDAFRIEFDELELLAKIGLTFPVPRLACI
jgi:hypothetical protein